MYDTTPRIRRRYCPISIAAVVGAAVLMLAAAIVGSDMAFRLGLTVFMLATTALVTIRTGVNTEVIEHARQAGYDAGYADGETVQPTPPIELRRIV